MKKTSAWILAALILLTVSATGGIAASDPVQLIRHMMDIYDPAMTVAAFNEAIEKVCADAGTNVFAVLSQAYEQCSVYDDSGAFLYCRFDDPDMERFVQTTLSYSAQELFGEPVHLGSIMRITLPGQTAVEVAEQRNAMRPDEWDRFYQQNLEDLSIFPIVSYAIEARMPDSQALTVAERDGRINDAHARIETFVLEMDDDSTRAENIWDIVSDAFDQISAALSDDKMTVICHIQGIERDAAHWGE